MSSFRSLGKMNSTDKGGMDGVIICGRKPGSLGGGVLEIDK